MKRLILLFTIFFTISLFSCEKDESSPLLCELNQTGSVRFTNETSIPGLVIKMEGRGDITQYIGKPGSNTSAFYTDVYSGSTKFWVSNSQYNYWYPIFVDVVVCDTLIVPITNKMMGGN